MRPSARGNLTVTQGMVDLDVLDQLKPILEGMKKSPTVEELKMLMVCLSAEISSLRADHQQLTQNQSAWRPDVKQLKEESAGLSKQLGEVQQKQETELQMVWENLKGVRADLNSTVEAENQRLLESTAKLEASIKELTELTKSSTTGLAADVATLRDAVVRVDNQQSTRLGAVLQQLEQEIRSTTTVLREDLTQRLETTAAAAAKELQEFEALQNERDAAQEIKEAELEHGLKTLMLDLEARLDHQQRQESAAVQEKVSLHADTLAQLRDELEQSFNDVNSRLNTLRLLVSEVENLPTRRVEWQIPQVSSALQNYLAATQRSGSPRRGWMSPSFEAAGGHALRFEVQHHMPDDASHAGGSSDGDCIICLWADAGLHLVFKLYTGSASIQASHTFDGQSPSGTGLVCSLSDLLSSANDTLTIGVEILEAVRTVERQSQTSSEVTDLLRVPPSTITSQRFLNHRLYDLVRSQVELMQSRMVRRIEWKIEKASMLRRCFPEGECICSATFEAAGVENLQLVFYPSGFQGVREGFCSFFLHCPGGSALKCWLCVGKQKREAKLTFERDGFFGRTNFCRFDSCLEPGEDSILLVLEIDEAVHVVSEHLSHATAVGIPSSHNSSVQTASLASPNPSLRGMKDSKAESGLGQVEKIDSAMKLRRAVGRQGLEDVRQLPSIWTPRPAGNLPEALEGYYTFGEMKAAKSRPDTARRAYLPQVPWKVDAAHAHPPAMSEKMAQRYIMYAS